MIGPNNFSSTPQVVVDPAAPILTYYRRHLPVAHPTPLVADPKPIQTYSRRAKALESNREQPGLLTTPVLPNLLPSQPNSSTSIHPMITRSRKFSSQSNQNAFLAETFLETESKTYNQVKLHSHWIEAMTKEHNALLANQTWVIVPPSTDQNVVGCKWVFKIKRRADGSIERYKARLVAKGFH